MSPDNHRSVSLQERQAQMLRDKIRALEMRIMDMIRHGNENMIITEKLQKWACELLQTPASERVPSALKTLKHVFKSLKSRCVCGASQKFLQTLFMHRLCLRKSNNRLPLTPHPLSVQVLVWKLSSGCMNPRKRPLWPCCLCACPKTQRHLVCWFWRHPMHNVFTAAWALIF